MAPTFSPFPPYHCPGLSGVWWQCPPDSPPDPSTEAAFALSIVIVLVLLIAALMAASALVVRMLD